MSSSKRGVDFLKQIAEFSVKNGGHDAILKALKITSGGEGRCIGEFTVAKEHLNPFGSLHGGYTATIIDNVTSYALVSKDSLPGVSIDLRVSYLKGAKEGDDIIVEATTVKAGRKLAYIDCVLKKKSDSSVIAIGSQTKYIEASDSDK